MTERKTEGLTTEALAAIRKRAEAATAGPWEADIYTIYHEEGGHIAEVVADNQFDNMHFIAHAREDIPALLAEVERLRSLMKDIRECSDIETVVSELADIGLNGGDTE